LLNKFLLFKIMNYLVNYVSVNVANNNTKNRISRVSYFRFEKAMPACWST